jgi:hypothetical protein
MTYPRLMPDVDDLVVELLRMALPDAVAVRNELEAALLNTLPYVMVQSSVSEDHPRFGWTAAVEVTCWTGDSRSGCAALAEGVRVSLYAAHRAQLVLPAGHLSTYSLPAPGIRRVPSGHTGVWRYAATYQLGIRPPAAP